MNTSLVRKAHEFEDYMRSFIGTDRAVRQRYLISSNVSWTATSVGPPLTFDERIEYQPLGQDQ